MVDESEITTSTRLTCPSCATEQEAEIPTDT